jgi:hypothetical protein
VAGAGGGFDLFCGLPLYFGLRAAGRQVHLANLSFSALGSSTARQLSSALFEVTADTGRGRSYFPEYYLCQWFRAQGEEVPIYWGFRLAAVAERILYLEAMRQTETYWDVSQVIDQFQASLPAVREWRGLPM